MSCPSDTSTPSRPGRLPPHHRDPFDRMLVAQAGVEGLALMTHDARILRYDVTTYPV